MAVLLALVLVGCGVWLLRSRPVSTVEARPGLDVASAADPAHATSTDPAGGGSIASQHPAQGSRASTATSRGPTPRASASRRQPASAPSVSAIRVHVTGRVRHPGVHALDPGSRVVDAVAAAGGLAAGAHPGSLNMAEPVCDGCQVVIPGSGNGRLVAPGGAPVASGGRADGGSGGAGATPGPTDGVARQPVDLNTADRSALESLDGVGPVMAGRILDWRTAHGRFTRVEELQEVEGVGPKTFARLKGLVRVS